MIVYDFIIIFLLIDDDGYDLHSSDYCCAFHFNLDCACYFEDLVKVL